MNETLTPDLCVIGGGAGGMAAALAAANRGASVVLVEKGDVSDTSAQCGMPALRALAAASQCLANTAAARPFGITIPTPTVSYPNVLDHVRSRVKQMAATVMADRLNGLGIRVIRAPGRFADAETVMAGDITIAAGHTVVATGAAAVIPAASGYGAPTVAVPESIWMWPNRPEHLAVLGSGPYALELAQAYHRLGARVTVIAEDKALANFDPELADPLLDALRDEGLFIAEGVRVEKLEVVGSGLRLSVSAGSDSDQLDASHLLLCGARSPRTEGLALDAAGVIFDRTGIHADATGLTANRKVSAIGDVVAGSAGMNGSAATARAAGVAVVERRLGGITPALADIPRAVRTDPGLAVVGLDEDAARRRYGAGIRIARIPFGEVDEAIASRATFGFIKAVARQDGRILGASILGVRADDLLHPWAVAIAGGMTLSTMATAWPVHPGFGAASQAAAATFAARQRLAGGATILTRLRLRR
jgi:pyruvate/2-oxoglutarate dehydrogenase complex dihydrolipoamide dehydrogenase (E3) component